MSLCFAFSSVYLQKVKISSAINHAMIRYIFIKIKIFIKNYCSISLLEKHLKYFKYDDYSQSSRLIFQIFRNISWYYEYCLYLYTIFNIHLYL